MPAVPAPLAALVARAEDSAAAPESVRAAVRELLERDPAVGCATALGILSREPRIKPSHGLVIDPGNCLARRWAQRVEACRALVASTALPRVIDEVRDELSDDPDLAAEVLAGDLLLPDGG